MAHSESFIDLEPPFFSRSSSRTFDQLKQETSFESINKNFELNYNGPHIIYSTVMCLNLAHVRYFVTHPSFESMFDLFSPLSSSKSEYLFSSLRQHRVRRMYSFYLFTSHNIEFNYKSYWITIFSFFCMINFGGQILALFSFPANAEHNYVYMLFLSIYIKSLSWW